MQGRTRWLTLATILLTGCQGEEAAPPTPAVAQVRAAFDVAGSGAILGKVTWQGDIPIVRPFRVHAFLDSANAVRLRGEQPNPHAPVINPATRGVQGAAVMLSEATLSTSRPWQHAPVQVHLRHQRLTVVQGDEPQAIGFVHRGAEFECINYDVSYHSLRARGAAYFTLPLVAADQATKRRLDQSGLVELGSGASCYWQRAYLFVLDHPYAALTGATGEFMLDQVPAGVYRLTMWMPNWRVEREERDPETAAIRRIAFAAPVELVQEVTVVAGQVASVSFTVAKNDFGDSKATE